MIPTQYMIIGAVGLACLAGGIGYIKGKESGLERYYDYKSSVEATMEVIRLENEQRVQAMADVAHDATERWEAARIALARNPVVRVRPHSCPGEMPSLSATPTVAEGLQASSGESWITATQCEQIANDSTLDREWIETVKQLTDDWHEASK